MTALWVACPAVEVERDTVDVSTEIKIFSLRSLSSSDRKSFQTFPNGTPRIPRSRFTGAVEQLTLHFARDFRSRFIWLTGTKNGAGELAHWRQKDQWTPISDRKVAPTDLGFYPRLRDPERRSVRTGSTPPQWDEFAFNH
jgi:hypothetical protein